MSAHGVRSTHNLAEYLGLSEWTVSRAINGHPEVKKSTRERILKAMDELGFRPNPIARRLSGKALGIVGVCFVSAHGGVMIDKITQLDEYLYQHGLRAILAITSADKDKELKIIKEFLHLQVDGVVLIQSVLEPALLYRALGRTPFVHIDPFDPRFTSKIWLDRVEATRMVLQHLLDLGHRTFGMLGITKLDNWRWPGMIQALEDFGLNPADCVCSIALNEEKDESYAAGAEMAKQVLEFSHPPTALIALNDQIAIGAIRALVRAGRRVPEDFSIVGFDNLILGRFMQPSITTIDQQVSKVISSAGKVLLDKIGKKHAGETEYFVRIAPKLIVRQSTGQCPRKSFHPLT